MARAVLFGCLRRAPSVLKSSSILRPCFATEETNSFPSQYWPVPNPSWVFRNLSQGSVHLVISDGKPKFETYETDPPKKHKWLTKKKFKMQRMMEKQKRKAANKRQPCRLGIKRNKKVHKFPNAEEKIKYRLEKARVKMALLVEKLKGYEIPKLQGPVVEPSYLTGEERFYMKKIAQKKSNYAPVGKRGIFCGVILNMHLHWKKHETVKVICKPCKPGQVQEYAQEIARLSGGIPIHIVGHDTIIFYRGKNYVQPEIMSPIDSLSKKRALEKSRYEESLESVRHFIALAEKELELYYRHIALYNEPNDRNLSTVFDSHIDIKETEASETLQTLGKKYLDSTCDFVSGSFAQIESYSDSELSESDDIEDDKLLVSESD